MASLNDSHGNGLATVGVDDAPPEPHVRRLHEPEEGLPVELPLPGKLRPLGELAAAELHGDLEAVGVEVVEVLHAAGDVVPEIYGMSQLIQENLNQDLNAMT